MANNVSEQDCSLAARLAKNMNLAKLLLDEKTEWSGIVQMQNTLDAEACGRYMTALETLGVTTVGATVEQRVEAFIKAMLRK
jgi:phenylalanine-4-hydroxylase